MDPTPETLDLLRRKARAAADRAHVPYSGRRTAAALLLSDGTWVPGVRVESASFSLVIPALMNAFTTAVASGRTDVVAAALNRPLRPEDVAYAHDALGTAFRQTAGDLLVVDGAEALPRVGDRLNPFLDAPIPEEPGAGITLARAVARRAYVPESAFPVGCVLVADDGRCLPGVNVEHADWSRTLCAERNGLGTAVTWNRTALRTLYVTCLNDPTGSPCGACRQLLAELAPAATLWMDRGSASPETSTPERLLPGAFQGRALTRSA